MTVHLVKPSTLSFGIAIITPRWLYVLAAATPDSFGDPLITDETLEPLDPATIHAGDVVGIGIHTGNALRGYEVGQLARLFLYLSKREAPASFSPASSLPAAD